MPHKVVGEGTYGCVIKPSMSCQEKEEVDYKNKVSKVMLKKDAKEEYDEMQKISIYSDIQKYIVPMPHICKPKLDAKFLATIKKCKNEKLHKNDPETYNMLVIEDGGITIEQFLDSVVASLGEKDVCIFLSKVYDLMEGLCAFHKYHIIHHDIHMKNVVYNIETGSMRFIDFGLMQTRDEFVKNNIQNNNGRAQSWFNFPPEYKCANKEDYHICNLSLPYTKYLERLADTFDWYSLGVMMQTVMKLLSSKISTISNDKINTIYHFFLKIANPNIERRDYDINKVPSEYKKLLQSINVWRGSNVRPEPSVTSIRLHKSIMKKSVAQSKFDLFSLIGKINKICANGELYDKKTRKCLKTCKPGFTRNKKTKRCRKKRRNTEKRKIEK